jgi:NADH-quinone oxidoreductase subunit C
MTDLLEALAAHCREALGDAIADTRIAHRELTLEVKREEIPNVCRLLRDHPRLAFEQLIDLCGVDYLDYRKEAPAEVRQGKGNRPRFAVVYHLLSVRHNQRLRLRVFLDDEMPLVASVMEIWNSANWFEREAFDLFGIMFDGHPDLRRLLTDYGFIGNPFRKDFPLSGEVEVRYDEEKQRVVYQPVTIEPRVLVPRVIREEGFGGRNP